MIMKTTKLKKLTAWCCITIFVLCQYPAVTLMAKNTSDSRETAEVEEFIKELYEAQSNRDVNRIREGLDDDVVTDWAIKLLPLYSDDIDFGFQEYTDIKVKAYSTSVEDYFVAYVSSGVVIEWDGERLALPGFNTFLVRKNENSQWCITSMNGLSDELVEKLEEEMLQMIGYDEVYDWMNAISTEYNDMLANTPGLSDRILDVNTNVVHYVASEELWFRDAWDYLFGEENGVLTASLNGQDDGVYVVQKGDCLWRIAERELGDGMYWVKLYEANRDVIGENPDLLWVGTELELE